MLLTLTDAIFDLLHSDSSVEYTRQKKKLLAFSFANFKITRLSTGKQ